MNFICFLCSCKSGMCKMRNGQPQPQPQHNQPVKNNHNHNHNHNWTELHTPTTTSTQFLYNKTPQPQQQPNFFQGKDHNYNHNTILSFDMTTTSTTTQFFLKLSPQPNPNPISFRMNTPTQPQHNFSSKIHPNLWFDHNFTTIFTYHPTCQALEQTRNDNIIQKASGICPIQVGSIIWYSYDWPYIHSFTTTGSPLPSK